MAKGDLRAQLEKVEQQTGIRPPQLDSGGDLPENFRHVWGWFLDLSEARAGYNPLSFAEIEAFFRLQRIAPYAQEIEALRALDQEWLKHKADSAKKD